MENLAGRNHQKKAKEEMREIEDQVRRRVFLPDQKIPLFKSVAQDWLEYKKPNVRFSSWDGYRGHVDHHFDDFNDLKINRISTAAVEKFIRKKQEAETNISTLRRIVVTLNQIFQYAVRHGYIEHNPARDAERPKKPAHLTEDTEDSRDMQILPPAQISAFFDAVSNPKYKTLFMLGILGGLRQGEILGAKWSDIDWENNQIHV